MGSVCTDHHHHHMKHLFSSSSSSSSPTAKGNKSHGHLHHHLQDLNIPPRKLLSRRSPPHSPIFNNNNNPSSPVAVGVGGDQYLFSPSSPTNYSPNNSRHHLTESLLMHKLLTDQAAVHHHHHHLQAEEDHDQYSYDPDSDPYSSDDFRMYEFKIRRCTRSRSHDWTDCPFAHPGEKARRRDPRRYNYSATVCPEYRRSGGSCGRGDECEFAHGVFEVWLHPARYRTEACKDGKSCKRKVCFFAHSPRELRVLPVDVSSPTAGSDGDEPSAGFLGNCNLDLPKNNGCHHCCSNNINNIYGHGHAHGHARARGHAHGGNYSNCSPRSTLMGMSANCCSSSPPLSPSPNNIKTRFGSAPSSFSPTLAHLSRAAAAVADRRRHACLDHQDDELRGLTYSDLLGHLINTLGAVNFNDLLLDENAAAANIDGSTVDDDVRGNIITTNADDSLWVDVDYAAAAAAAASSATATATPGGDDHNTEFGMSPTSLRSYGTYSSSPLSRNSSIATTATTSTDYGGGGGGTGGAVFDSYSSSSCSGFARSPTYRGGDRAAPLPPLASEEELLDLGWVNDLLM